MTGGAMTTSERAALEVETLATLDEIRREVRAIAAGVRELRAGQRLLLEEMRACARGTRRPPPAVSTPEPPG